jgi:7,8-dihydropterin-6-yl-methyl-4-(beta-D-ribofuranosyl)aminobenzene 5'-phosphate synthase
MKITILVENQISHAAAKTCSAEWGLSFFIETGSNKILFDTGHTDIYKRNAKKLNVDLQKTDFIVLSHHHWDHAGGLRFHEFESSKRLIAHPLVLEKFYQDYNIRLEESFNACLIKPKDPFEFIKDIFFLGEIPHTTSFEKGLYKGKPIPDDSAIAVRGKEGAIVISGCSHSGIANICEYAKKVTGQDLYAVIGGFHLFEKETEAVEGTVAYFKKEKPKYLYPMHCVDFPTLTKFRNVFGIEKMSTGDVIYIE